MYSSFVHSKIWIFCIHVRTANITIQDVQNFSVNLGWNQKESVQNAKLLGLGRSQTISPFCIPYQTVWGISCYILRIPIEINFSLTLKKINNLMATFSMKHSVFTTKYQSFFYFLKWYFSVIISKYQQSSSFQSCSLIYFSVYLGALNKAFAFKIVWLEITEDFSGK